MASFLIPDGLIMAEVATYHNDTVDSLKTFLRFSNQETNPRFLGYTVAEFNQLLRNHTAETETRSCFVMLALIEAAFTVDYLNRVSSRSKDPLSREFRHLYKIKGDRPSLGDDILLLWSKNHPGLKRLVEKYRSQLKYRNWLAHGRYWERPTHDRFDYTSIYDLTSSILLSFPFTQGG